MAHNKKNNKDGVNRKKHIGKIFYVDFRHIVKPEDWEYYRSQSGRNPYNGRPVIVAVQRRGKYVQISKITHIATARHLRRFQRVRLQHTFPNENSYADTNTISKSRMTNKKFVVGEAPLRNSRRKANQNDINSFMRYRRYRGR